MTENVIFPFPSLILTNHNTFILFNKGENDGVSVGWEEEEINYRSSGIVSPTRDHIPFYV